MFKFIKKIFVSALMFFGSLSNVNSLECVSMKNQDCRARPEIINISINNPIFFPFSIKTNVVAMVIILVIHTQKFVLLTLKKT